MQNEQTEIIIIGAGIAGASLAATLGKRGRKVTLIERDLSEQHKIIGELMQPAGIEKLKKLGLDWCLEDIDSVKIEGYAVFWKGESIPLSYPEKDNQKAFGRSFHHGRFIQQLRKAAMKEKSVTAIQATATKLIEDEKGRVIGVEYKKENTKHSIFAPLTIVCDGLFSNFRKYFVGDKKVESTSSFYGIIIDNKDLPFENHGHVILMDSSPSLCYPISSTDARVLIDIPHPLPDSSNGDLLNYLKNVTAPQMPKSIRESFLSSIENKDKIRSMPSGKLFPHHHFKRGAILLGDAFNVRNPLTGGGMTVALSDVVIMDELLDGVDLNDEKLMFSKMEEFYKSRKYISSTINVLSHALYQVFSSNTDPCMHLVRKACFEYFKLGGSCVDGPISLLSGLNDSPSTLFYHFFSVALYGVYNQFYPFPSPMSIWNSFKMLKAASNVIFPLMYGEHVMDVGTHVSKL